METNNRELYEQFGSITGCKTNRRIAHYLEACDYDLATAVDLYFAQGGADTSQENDVAMISDDEDEIECAQGPSRSVQPSTSKATRRNGRNHYVDEEEVRAPIPSTRGTMLEAGYHQQYGVRHVTPTDSVFNRRDFRADAVEQERNLRNALNAMNAQPEVRELNGNQEAAHRSMLQDLFRPPTDISFSGPFEAAKEVACDMGKWLLVNVQDIKEFACQTLNRDIWANEGVKELIQTNFVFWQIRHDSVDGQRLNNYYKLKTYPAIFILDPRTGELVQNFVMKKQDPVTLCDFLTSYLDKFPDYFAHDRFLKGVPHGSEIDAFDPGNVPQFAAEPECSKSAMFDDEEMERTSSRKRKANGSGEKIKKAKMQALDGLNDSTRMLSVVDKDEWKQHVARTGEICRIRLKLPDGKVEIIEITNNSKLKALFVFLAGRTISPKEHMFVLSFPRREYSLEDGDRSLSELGFAKNEMFPCGSMASDEVWELCDKLRAERLLIASELLSLKDLHSDVKAKQIKHSLLSWKSCQISLISHRLLSSHRLVSPDNTCSIVSQLEECEPLEAYKRFGHHYSNITRILVALYKNPLAIAEFISADAPHNVTTEDLVYSTASLVFGNGSYPTDEKRLLEVLKHLIKVQLMPANNPRLILRKGNSAFPRLYKLFSESLFSVKIFLTSALHEAVMHVLCQDEIFLDIDPSKSPQRFPAAERARRFGTDPTSAQYHKRMLAHRKVIVEKLVLLAHGFIKAITDALCCFPECLVWLVQEMYRSLVANQRMSEAEAHLICTDLIVTNLLCPAITNPENVGVISDTPISHIARFNLMQIGQIIQTLALSRYEAAPPHFQTFTTQFNDSPICAIVDTLLGRECQDVDKFYPTVLSETNGDEMLKRRHFIGSVWEVNNLIAVLQTDAVNNISTEEIKQELLTCSNKLPASFSSASADVSNSSSISPHIPRQNRLKNFADRVHNSLSQSPTRVNGGNRVIPSSALPAELFDVVIFDLPVENELTGLVPEDKFMENKTNSKKLFETRKKRARFVEDDSVVGSAVSDITADNASDLEEEAAAQDDVGSVSSSQEAPQEDRMLILDEDAESTLPDNVSDVGGISGRGSPSLSGRDTPLSQGPRDVVDNIAISLASGAELDDVASRDLQAISVALKKSNAEGLEEKFGKFNVPTGTLGSCKDDQRSILSEAWSTNVAASDDEGNATPSGRALLAQLPIDGYSNRQRPINRAGSMTGATEDRSDTWSLDAVASDSEVDGKEKQRNANQHDHLPAIVTQSDVPVAPLIDISSSNDIVSERRRSSGSSFSYARSDVDSETGRQNDYQSAQPTNQSNGNGDQVCAGDSTAEEAGSATGSRQSDALNADSQGGSKRRSGIMMGLQRVGDKVRKGITNTRQLPQSSTISDFFGDLRDKKKGAVPQSFSTNQLSELDPRTADDILAKYQRPTTSGSSELSPNMSPPLGIAPELPSSESVTAPYYDAENVLECRAFLDAKRKLRLVLSSVGNLSANRICDNNAMRPERDQLNVVLRTLLAEAVNSRQQVLSAHVREVMRCLQMFDNKGIHLLLRTLGDEQRARACYISYLQQSRLSLLRLISYEEQLTLQVERQKTLTEECLTDVLIRFYLENKDNQLRRFLQEFSQLHAQDEKIECLNRTLNALFVRLPNAPMWKDITPTMKEYLHKALERVVMFQIHGMAFYPNHEADRHRDEVLHRALAKLSRSITPDHPMLRIPKVLHGESPWPSAQAEINILNAYKSARDKLACVVRCCETISNLVTMAGTGAAAADDVTPVLVYVLIQANPPALLSNVQYIQSFGGTLLNGVEGYWWTQFAAAIEFIKTLL